MNYYKYRMVVSVQLLTITYWPVSLYIFPLVKVPQPVVIVMNATQTQVRRVLSLKDSETATILIRRLRFNDYPSSEERYAFHLMIADYNQRLLSSCRLNLITCGPHSKGLLQHARGLINLSEVWHSQSF